MTQENELIKTSLNEIYRKISIQQYKTDMGFTNSTNLCIPK